MTICYFGDYDPDYSRTRVILNGLEELGVTILHCNVREKGLKKYFKLWRAHQALHGQYDLIFIPMSNSRIFSFVAKCFSRKPVVWEPLFSLYDNWVYDRKLATPHSLKAYYYWFLDWIGCTFADLVILDTETNADYFHQTFWVPKRKLAHVYIGTDERIFFPRARIGTEKNFEVEFHGGYIPLQGADVIVRAAKLLENKKVHFTMIGSGQMRASTEALAAELHLTNITFLPFLSKLEITAYIGNADVCIGLIGDVPRVARAIPNKLYEAAAMGKLSINADTPALRELFTPGKDVIAIPQGDHNALAAAIANFMQHPQKAKDIGAAARETYLKWGTNARVGQQALNVLSRIIR